MSWKFEPRKIPASRDASKYISSVSQPTSRGDWIPHLLVRWFSVEDDELRHYDYPAQVPKSTLVRGFYFGRCSPFSHPVHCWSCPSTYSQLLSRMTDDPKNRKTHGRILRSYTAERVRAADSAVSPLSIKLSLRLQLLLRHHLHS